jgi:hypothetical protein
MEVIQQIHQQWHDVGMSSGTATGGSPNLCVIVSQKSRGDRGRQAASEVDGGIDGIAQSGALNHAIGDDA